jgi:hypothetical protein
MTDFSVTISESIRSFGGGPTSKWNDTWNQFKWGAGTYNVLHDVEHYIPESQASSDYRINFLERYFSESQASSDLALHALDIIMAAIGNTLSTSDGLGSVGKYDAAGYLYTRLKVTTSTETTGNSTSWTETVPNSTTWGES